MKHDLVKIECDFCGYSDTFDVRDGEKVMKAIRKWIGILRGNDPPPGANGGADTHKWYDCPECAIAALQGERDTAAANATAEAAIAKAN